MTYRVELNRGYDFAGQSYASKYPNLHKYPATMLPQIGIKILQELNVTGGKLLDPYCGSGSSFTAALDRGISKEPTVESESAAMHSGVKNRAGGVGVLS